MDKLVLDRNAAADALDISLPTLDAFINRDVNPLPVFRVGRHIKIPVDALRQWLASETRAQNARGGGA